MIILYHNLMTNLITGFKEGYEKEAERRVMEQLPLTTMYHVHAVMRNNQTISAIFL